MAKPVGIAFADDHEGEGSPFVAIVVVCDDGSVWAQQDRELSASGWHEGAPVPGSPLEKLDRGETTGLAESVDALEASLGSLTDDVKDFSLRLKAVEAKIGL